LGEVPDGGCFCKRKDELLVRQTTRHIGHPKCWEKERNLEEDTCIQNIKEKMEKILRKKKKNAHLKTATKTNPSLIRKKIIKIPCSLF